MSKFGWKDIQDRFFDATGKLHDSEQFGYRFRELRKLWVFIDYLRHVATGVGSREDGSWLLVTSGGMTSSAVTRFITFQHLFL
jgi:hypothetical protein